MTRTSKLAGATESVGLLIARLTLAAVFIPAGWGKFQNLDQPIGYFETLGIPFPSIMAPMVAGLELVCGVLLLIGLFARLAALPIIAIMIVAIATAKMSEISGIMDLADITEFLYIALAIVVAGFGPGRISIDKRGSKRNKQPNLVHRSAH